MDILHASKTGDITEVVDIIQSRADVNTKDATGYTPLMFSINRVYPEISNLLLDAKADVMCSSIMGTTALHLLCERWDDRDVQLLRRLCVLRANVDSMDMMGNTPMLYAATRSIDLTMIDVLWEFGADIHICNRRGESALHLACQFNRLRTVEWLLDRGADVNCCDLLSITPLMMTVSVKCVTNNPHSIIDLLIARGGDVNHMNAFCETVLEYVIARVDLIELFYRAASEKSLYRTFFLCCQYGCLDAAKYLYAHAGIKVNIPEGGMTPFFVACLNLKTDVVEWLHSVGADVTASHEGVTPLYMVSKINKNLMVWLLMHDAVLNRRGNVSFRILRQNTTDYSCITSTLYDLALEERCVEMAIPNLDADTVAIVRGFLGLPNGRHRVQLESLKRIFKIR